MPMLLPPIFKNEIEIDLENSQEVYWEANDKAKQNIDSTEKEEIN